MGESAFDSKKTGLANNKYLFVLLLMRNLSKEV